MSGASQKHKHMQMIPKDIFMKVREDMGGGDSDSEYPLPIEDVIQANIENSVWTSSEIITSPSTGAFEMSHFYRIPQFSFKHSLVILIDEMKWNSASRSLSYSGNIIIALEKYH